MDNYFDEEYELRRKEALRKKRRLERKKKKRRRAIIILSIYLLIAALLLFGLIFGIVKLIKFLFGKKNAEEIVQEPAYVTEQIEPEVEEIVTEELIEEPEDIKPKYYAEKTEYTTGISDEVASEYAILIDVDNGTILADRKGDSIIYPASMTKVLTILVAAENVANLDDTVTMTFDVLNYGYVHDLSEVGFSENEVVSVRDLFYGTILPSGADAALSLANYVAGSEEAFVDLMNKKVEELGLSDTAHFTNCTGMYNDNHKCTAYDMAMIMEAALENEFCREVLSAHRYTITTEMHPDGIALSNLFLRRIEDHIEGGTVNYAKTGFVVESRNCAVSSATDDNGKTYICVTASSTSAWKCIFDHIRIYHAFFNK